MAWNRRMKISQNSYRSLAAAVQRSLATNPDVIEQYGGITQRLLWDLFWHSKYPANDLYNAGLNDNSIETALRSIVKDAQAQGISGLSGLGGTGGTGALADAFNGFAADLGARPRKGAGSAPGQASLLFGRPAPRQGFRIAGSRCQGPDGRFVKKTECGLPPAQVRTGCRDAGGKFVNVPQCTGRGVSGLGDAGGAAVGSFVRPVDGYQPHWPQAQANGAWPVPVGDQAQRTSWIVGIVEGRAYGGLLDVRWVTEDGPMPDTFPTNPDILTEATKAWMSSKGWGF